MLNFLNFKKKTPEKQFWKWFVENKNELEKLITTDTEDYSVYNTLTAELKKYNEYLFPEITTTEKGVFVLVITPDGIKKGVLPTQNLFDAKPEIEHWIVKKFRQPNNAIDLNFDGVEYPSSDIEILPEVDAEKGKINIRLFIRNMDEDEKKYQSLAWLYLDHILGEFNTITKIGFIEFFNVEADKCIIDSISILELRDLIEKEIYKVNSSFISK